MEMVIRSIENKEIGKLEINDSLFNAPKERIDILHRVVQWQLSNARSGCHKTKGRGEVAGSTRKIYKQKGTGQARHGAITAPIFVGGGVVFGPVVRSHGYKLNKKIRKLGLKIALSLKHADSSIILIDSIKPDEVRLSTLREKLAKFNAKSMLIIDVLLDEKLKKSVSNLKHVNVLPVAGLNVRDILKYEKIMITTSAIENIQGRLV